MTDADVEIQIKSLLDSRIAASAPFSALVAQSYQPTQQGAPLQATVLFSRIAARRYGFQGVKYVYNSGPDDFTKTESWYLQATYQINALITQNPNDVASLNAYDVVDFCAGALQLQETRATFLLAGIGIQRIADIRNPRFKDDSDRFAMDPSFDFVLTYQNDIVTTISAATVTGIANAVPDDPEVP